ncbi:MAG: hypothetical protein JW798_08180, partial [Prolixibacteraceae bacterium]|nr:hypothetical protein [Prolixibacteraceae bacterium]
GEGIPMIPMRIGRYREALAGHQREFRNIWGSHFFISPFFFLFCGCSIVFLIPLEAGFKQSAFFVSKHYQKFRCLYKIHSPDYY